jgi:FkbM family methyltransferase
VFIDVGANIGYFTLLAAKRVGASGAVVAVEAMPAIFQHLAAHATANGLSNTRLINEAAVGPNDPPEVQLYWGGAGNIGSNGMLQHGTQTESVTVKARTLAQMLTPEESRRARLIKVDVEGVEGRTIRGLGLERDVFNERVELIVEIAANAEGETDPVELLQYFAGLGFFPYELREDHYFQRYAYPASAVTRPQRVRQPLTGVHNVIFSKVDAESL